MSAYLLNMPYYMTMLSNLLIYFAEERSRNLFIFYFTNLSLLYLMWYLTFLLYL